MTNIVSADSEVLSSVTKSKSFQLKLYANHYFKSVIRKNVKVESDRLTRP